MKHSPRCMTCKKRWSRRENSFKVIATSDEHQPSATAERKTVYIHLCSGCSTGKVLPSRLVGAFCVRLVTCGTIDNGRGQRASFPKGSGGRNAGDMLRVLNWLNQMWKLSLIALPLCRCSPSNLFYAVHSMCCRKSSMSVVHLTLHHPKNMRVCVGEQAFRYPSTRLKHSTSSHHFIDLILSSRGLLALYLSDVRRREARNFFFPSSVFTVCWRFFFPPVDEKSFSTHYRM